MKTAVIKKFVWALVLGLGLVLAAQAQPVDSTGTGRINPIPPSSATTGIR